MLMLTKILLNLGMAGIVILGGLTLSQWIRQESMTTAMFVPVFAVILLVGIYMRLKERRRKRN